MNADGQHNLRLGLLAWTATVLIGASWQLATRLGVTTTLSPVDLALLRYVIPAVALFPVLMRHGIVPKDTSLWALALIVVGGGLPFGLLGMAGAQFAPASHMGALLPGSMPVFVALLSALFLGERFGVNRLFGLSIITAGVACVVSSTFLRTTGGSNVLLGDSLFISAGVLWAIYTVAYKKSGLDPWYGAALVCFWSSVPIVPIWFFSPNAALLVAPFHDVFLQVLAQGLLAGLLGLAAYGAAIRHLGASVAGASGAVVPVMTAFGGVVFLNETLSLLTGIGIACVVSGLWIYAGSPGVRLLQLNG